MAIHKTKSRLAYTNITEFLTIAKKSIDLEKSPTNNGAARYGAPALALLLASLDAIGAFYDKRLRLKELPTIKKKNEPGACLNHFEKIQAIHSDLLEKTDVKVLYGIRNDILHSALISPDYLLIVGDENMPLLQNNANSKTEINLIKLNSIVKEVYNNYEIDLEQIDPGYRSHTPSTSTGNVTPDQDCLETSVRQNDANLDNLQSLLESLTTNIRSAGINNHRKLADINRLLNQLQSVSKNIVNRYGKKVESSI